MLFTARPGTLYSSVWDTARLMLFTACPGTLYSSVWDTARPTHVRNCGFFCPEFLTRTQHLPGFSLQPLYTKSCQAPMSNYFVIPNGFESQFQVFRLVSAMPMSWPPHMGRSICDWKPNRVSARPCRTYQSMQRGCVYFPILVIGAIRNYSWRRVSSAIYKALRQCDKNWNPLKGNVNFWFCLDPIFSCLI